MLPPWLCVRSCADDRRHIDATVTLVQHHWTASARCPLKSSTDTSALALGRSWHHSTLFPHASAAAAHASAAAAVSARFSIGRCFRALQPLPLVQPASASAAVSARFSIGRCFRTLDQLSLPQLSLPLSPPQLSLPLSPPQLPPLPHLCYVSPTLRHAVVSLSI